MLIKFTGGGRGGGGTIAAYLTDPERQGRGHAPPEVVRGDMARTHELIDSIERKWTYTHGVVCFALEDAPSETQQREVMDAFERLAFAGLDREQFDITWVRHQHTQGGRVELHFVVPRLELTTGKALNIAPPGWESSYAPLRDVLNHSNGWARPDDPDRARELHRVPERAVEGFVLRKTREGVHGYLSALVVAQRVTDRAEMVQALEDAGLAVPRQGKSYLTVLDPESGERFRLKGRIYEKDWTYDAEIDRAVASAAGKPDSRDRGIDHYRVAQARGELERRVRGRAAFHAERYPHDDRSAGCGLAEAEAVRALVVGDTDRDVADDRGLLCLALDAAPDSRDRALPDLHVRGRDISDAARGGAGLDVQVWRSPDALRGIAEGGVDHGPVDGVRAGFTRTVREFGGGLRRLVEIVRRYGESLAGVLGAYRQEGAEPRGATRGVGDSVERADAGNASLGRCCQQVVGRTAVLEQEHSRERGMSMDLDYGM